MFKKTKLRLVLLNTLVFFLLLNGFAMTLYFYTKHRLESQMDRSLQENAQHLLREINNGIDQRRGSDREAEKHLIYVLYDVEGKVLKQMPDGAFFPEDMRKLTPEAAEEGFCTVTLGEHDYRVYNLPVQVTVRGLSTPVRTLQVLSDAQPTQEMLNSLLMVILSAGAVSALLALGVGYYLASRALLPIQKAWNKQQEFVADASHELRTPLTVMKASLERLFRHPGHTIEQESVGIADAIDETNRMSKMVGQLLTLARSDSNELEILRQPLCLDVLVERTVARFREFGMMKEVVIEASVESPIEWNGDEERLQQLLVILLDNALKFTEQGGRITVSCRRVANAVQLEVADTGIGIPEDVLPQIFDRFFRGDKMRARTTQGTGLGLAIAKWIVEAHGGRIRAESQLGKGTTFYVRLPSRM